MRLPAANIASTTALVLCGGLGTRLRPVVGDRPKILAPIAGRPFAHYLIETLRDEGLVDIVLCTGYGAEQVIAGCGDGSVWSVRLRHSREPEPLGTGGAVKHSESLINSNPFLVINGDSYVDADLLHLLEFHNRIRARITMALVSLPDRERFGAVTLNSESAITAFGEKGHAGPGLINAGIYLIDRTVLDAIPKGQSISIENDVFPHFVDNGLYGLPMDGPFLDIGTPESYAEAEALFSNRRVRGDAEVMGLVLLDRDGTINVERHYLSSPEQLELLPGAAEGIQQMRELGLRIAVVTNQSAIGRGYFDLAMLERIHRRLDELLGSQGARVDGVFFCPHIPEDGCDCRKPKPGLAHEIARLFGTDLSGAFVVGDKACDIELGRNIGATTILVRTGYGEALVGTSSADFVAENLLEAAFVIERVLQVRQGDRTKEGRPSESVG